jgi:D-lactate dehydrogenase
VEFTRDILLPRLAVGKKLATLALHPTCSAGPDALLPLARAIADEVVVPDDWGCCGFAGDRGLLHPELTAAATRPEAASLAGRTFAGYASCNRACELGLTRATGHPYRHLVELVEEATR